MSDACSPALRLQSQPACSRWRRRRDEADWPDIRSNSKSVALLLDVDGTLLDVADKPELVVVPNGLVGTLAALRDVLGGALAIVTGRLIAEVDELFSPLKLVVAGVHGTEWRVGPSAGVSRIGNRPLSPIMDKLQELARRNPGVVIETKRAGLALHYRARPGLEPLLWRHVNVLVDSHDPTYRVEQGRKVIELLPKVHSKRRAVAQLLTEPLFAGRRPIAVGDDTSDEAPFELVESVGGIALPVTGEHFSRSCAAFGSPAEVRRWLAEATRSDARARPARASRILSNEPN